MNCRECGAEKARCDHIRQHQRKCCPDCRHDWDQTKEELVEALVRMYRRSRAAGVPEEDAVEGVVRRALP